MLLPEKQHSLMIAVVSRGIILRGDTDPTWVYTMGHAFVLYEEYVRAY